MTQYRDVINIPVLSTEMRGLLRPALPSGSRRHRGGAGYPQGTYAGRGGCGLKALGAGCGAGYPHVLRGGCGAGMVKVQAQYLVRQPATPFHKLTSLS